MSFEGLLELVRRDYPELKIRVGKKFMYRPPRTIFFEQLVRFEQKNGSEGTSTAVSSPGWLQNDEQNYCLQLLHEVGHALLHHVDYKTDVERLKMERAAWDKASELCERYGVRYEAEFAEMELDTYRDWLQQRSKCPECGLVRYQDRKGAYHCPFCENLR